MNPTRRRRQKTSSACQRCRSRKSGCDRHRPCQLCVRAGVPCVPSRNTGASPSSEQSVAVNTQASPSLDQTRSEDEERAVLPEQSIVELTTKIVPHGYPAYDTSALPGGKEMEGSVSASAQSWQDTIGLLLPPREVLDTLLDQFFNSVNWFMMIFHEEHFRQRYENFLTSTQGVNPIDNNFLWLALLALGLGAHYSSLGRSSDQDEFSLRRFSETIFTRVENKFCRIIGSPNVEAVQVCILLGSFHLFNGHPTSGIGILGSGVKIAQIIGLHRESMWKGISDINREVRRRSWWALEVFDKYAAIAFGRPCTIDESDCSVEPPADVRLEGQLISDQSALLEYHRQKFKLYRLMGPFLGRRSQTDRLETVNNLHGQLLLWQMQLPASLRLQTYKDDAPSEKPSLCQLQALALQLTYDNLQIILHRSVAFGDSRHNMTCGGTTDGGHDSSLHREQLLLSALRTSELVQYNHILQACRRTHAVMHVGICLFTAGIVLCAVILSEPLSLSSQKAKLGIMAIIRLHQNSFPDRQLLSAQSMKILEDSVAAVMQFEQQLILGGLRPRSPNTRPRNLIEADVVASASQDSGHGTLPAADNEAFLTPLQEVFAQHLQGGALGIESTNEIMNDQTPQNFSGSYEEYLMLGPPTFSWDGGLYSTLDPDSADANQLWLWSDSTLQNFL
ncbi:fungal-specific transcription factor domain-containing protein [Talaromyces proteolyticus]|uniref:Fungal-specific transcription factor domain-containing protein n=1 Tax=Talaromyces proteolyticus TaxID=1131652 RepID=A0AAD4Q5N3_9EURO|nr:fungal-specific transcription factor domain-containing protein [Talaromyces proteolyticus]KAH8704165.1 fungal-specific transcription factor domain-containing protein [Talaromyces proteolyticus]